MKSQPKLFISIIASIIITCGLVGFTVVRAVQHDQPKVLQQNSQYEASKKAKQPGNATQAPSNKSADQQPAPLAETPPQAAVTVYFSKSPDSETNPTMVYGVPRSLDGQTIAQSLVKELISGPTQEEKDNGFYGGIELTGASSCGGQDFKLSVNDGTATLQFCRDHVSGGLAEDTREQAQITTSLKQLPGISQVIILNQKNNCLFGANSAGICAAETP